jgi:hypothetical protein
VHQDIQVPKVLEDHRELKGLKALKVPQVHKVQEDHRGLKEQQVRQEIPVLKV